MTWRTKGIIFRIAVALVVTLLYAVSGALTRGWFDIPGMFLFLLLILPLTVIWIAHEVDEEEEPK